MKPADVRKALGVNFGRYYALVIGVAELPGRRQPVDADQRCAARGQGAEGSLRLQREGAGRRRTIAPCSNAFNDLASTLKKDDNLLVYFAGHGDAPEVGHARERLLAAPATRTSRRKTRSGYRTSRSPGTCSACPAQRVLVVADSCYAGLLSTDPSYRFADAKAGYTLDYIKYKVPKRSRLLVSSGGDAPVLDKAGGGKNSVFAEATARTSSWRTRAPTSCGCSAASVRADLTFHRTIAGLEIIVGPEASRDKIIISGYFDEGVDHRIEAIELGGNGGMLLQGYMIPGLITGDHAPTRNGTISSQTILPGATNWSYTAPAGLFSDPDGDAITYLATLSDGSALPYWLHFDSATRTFSGTAPGSDADEPASAAERAQSRLPAGRHPADLLADLQHSRCPRLRLLPRQLSPAAEYADRIEGLAGNDTLNGVGGDDARRWRRRRSSHRRHEQRHAARWGGRRSVRFRRRRRGRQGGRLGGLKSPRVSPLVYCRRISRSRTRGWISSSGLGAPANGDVIRVVNRSGQSRSRPVGIRIQ